MGSGDLAEDDNLARHGNAPAALSHQLWHYLREGGAGNAEQFFRCLAHHAFGWGARRAAAAGAARGRHSITRSGQSPPSTDWAARWAAHGLADDAPVVALLFYRPHLQAGNTAVFDALADALVATPACARCRWR